MPDKRFVRAFALSFSMLSLFSAGGYAQKKPVVDPSQKGINQKDEGDKETPFKKWAAQDVLYIITPAEKKAFDALKNNEERENFIAEFWRRRDPNPDTEANEYREEYYERISYANEHFTSGVPGWKTDRGRIYISRGKPDNIESHPTGGAYDRPSNQGGGSTTTYPFEVWFYRHLEGVGDGLEIEFVDPTGTGEYRLARDSGEKDALAAVPGAGFKVTGNNDQNLLGQQYTPFERLQITTDLMRTPPIKFNDLLEVANSPVIEKENSVDFDMRVDFFRQSDENVVAAITLQTENKELSFRDEGGIQTANMNILGRITSVTGRPANVFEDVARVNTTTQEIMEVKDHKSVYQKALSLKPGVYKIDVVVRDVVSGKTGVIKRGFTVPRYNSEKLSTSTLILASRLYQTSEKDLGGSFIIGDKKVIPNLSGVYKKGQEVGIYLQVYNSGIDQTTLRPAVDVEYVLLKDGKEISKQTENWEGLSDSGQRLTLARLIPTAQLAPGSYEIKIKIRDRVGDQHLEPSEKFTIIQ